MAEKQIVNQMKDRRRIDFGVVTDKLKRYIKKVKENVNELIRLLDVKN
jgi:hypothetical protein